MEEGKGDRKRGKGNEMRRGRGAVKGSEVQRRIVGETEKRRTKEWMDGRDEEEKGRGGYVERGKREQGGKTRGTEERKAE